MSPDAPSRRGGWAAVAVCVAGLAVSAYLTYVHYTEPASLSCPDTGVVNCYKVTTSPESMLFGTIPVALAGAVYFVVMAALCAPAMWRRHDRVEWARVAGAVGGIGMVVYLVYVEAAVVKAICLWCTVVHVLTFVLFVAIVAHAVGTLPDDDPDEVNDADDIEHVTIG